MAEAGEGPMGDGRAGSAKPLARGEGMALAAIALLGLAVHGWLARGADALDTDRSLVLLMARAFAAGDFSLYFWEQNYMGALEPLLLAPLAALGLATPTVASWVGIAITAGIAALSVWLARRSGGLAWLALLFWAIAPLGVMHHHVALYGARLTATLLAVGALALALRAAGTRAWIGAGVLLGVAYFGDHLMLTWAAGVAYVAARHGGLRGLAIGALPLVAFDTAAAVLTPAIHLAGPNDPVGWLGNLPLLVGQTIPQLFGFLFARGPSPLFEPAAPLIPPGSLWLLFALPGALALVALAVSLFDERARFAAARDDEGALIARALLLVCAAGLGLFLLVGGGGDRWPMRYLVPLWPAISVLAALAAARWRPALRPLAAAALLPAAFTLAADPTWPRGDDAAAARAEAAEVAAALERTRPPYVWADYWDAYRLELATGATRPFVTLRIIQRRPVDAAAAEVTGPVAYLLRPGDRETLDGIESARAAGEVAVLTQRDAGRYRLIVTDRTVPGQVRITSNPSRARQRAAALAAGLLFAGTLVGVGLLEAWERRRRTAARSE